MIELVGKYTTAKIYAETIEEGVYQQVYDIINCKAFEGQKVVCMPDVHVGASGPCGLVATIGNYVCPEHVGVDIGCSVSMMILDKKVPTEKYAEFERRIKNKIPFGFNINKKTVIDYKEFYKFLTTGFNKYRNYWPEMLMDLPNQVTEKWVSEQLARVGMDEGTFYKSLGSVGGGNHFIEYDEQKDGDLAGLTFHFGSRNFGVKVCKYWSNLSKGAVFSKNQLKDYTAEFKKDYLKTHDSMINFKKDLNAYLESKKEGHIDGYLTGDLMKGYLCDMCFCQLYAAFNHMTVQKVVKELLQKYDIKEVRTIVSMTIHFVSLRYELMKEKKC